MSTQVDEAASGGQVEPGAQASADRRVRTVIVGALGMSIVLWEIAFNFGAYRAIFFTRVHWLWVVITTVGICLVILRRDQTHVGWRGLVLLIIPSTIFVTQLIRAQQLVAEGPVRTLVAVLVLATYAAALPYTIFVIANIMDRDLIDLTSRRVAAALAAVAIVIVTMGFLVGQNHRVFLVCDDFTVAGTDVPDDCREGESELIFR